MKVGQVFNPYRMFVGAFIPNDILRNPKLTFGAKVIYARLCQYSGEKGECFPAIETLSAEVGIQKRQCLRYIEELEKMKLIRIDRPTGKDKLFHKTNRYCFIWNEIFDQNDTSESVVSDTSGNVVSDTSIVRESVLKESYLNNNIAKEKKEKPLLTPEELIKVKDIISFLNNTCFKKFNYDTKETQRLLKPILKQYDVELIKKTIAHKNEQWGGDDKMKPFLRPSTLFNFNHFESYYNELPYEVRNPEL